MKDFKNFSEKLISMEKTTPELKAKYESEVSLLIKMLLEQKLTPRKWYLIALISVILIPVSATVWNIIEMKGLPSLPMIGIALLDILGNLLHHGLKIAISFTIAVILFKVIHKASVYLKSDTKALGNLAWLLLLIALAITIFMLISGKMGRLIRGVNIIYLLELFFLGIGLLYFLQNRISMVEANLKEKLLEIELRIMEMKEDKGSEKKMTT